MDHISRVGSYDVFVLSVDNVDDQYILELAKAGLARPGINVA